MSSEEGSKQGEVKEDQDQWLFLLKDDVLEKKDDASPGFYSLRHPKSDELCQFLFPADNSCVYEILKHEEEHRSWFIGQTVQKDGGLFIPTAVDPVFLALPYIIKETQASGKFIPVDQLIADEEATGINRLCSCLEKTKLNCVADVKGDEDFRAVKYNADKTLSWLKRKVEILADTLAEKKVDISSGAHATIFQQHSAGTESSKEDHIRFAHGMVSDYISVSLSQDLKSFMNIKDPVKNREKPDNASEQPKSKKAKTGAGSEPLEDYSQNKVIAKDKSASKLSAAQNKLSKVDTKGMKSMASFFKKK